LFDENRLIITYIPVIHKALLEFFWEVQAPILILGKGLLEDFPQLEHDLRAIRPEEARQMLIGLGFKAEILSRSALLELSTSSTFILPKDEVMLEFAEKYLPNHQVIFQECFIRWHKKNVTSEESLAPDQVVSVSEFAKEMMGMAYKQADSSTDWWRQVGAVITQGTKVLVTAYNQYLPTSFSPVIDGDIRVCFGFGEQLEICGPIHAEASAIAHCARKGLATEGADLYCTTFPCPGCARSIIKAGIRRVFYVEGYSVADAHHILASGQVEIIKVKVQS